MNDTRHPLREQLEAHYFNGSTVDEIIARLQALEPRWRDFVGRWVLSVARTEPEIGYQFAALAGDVLQSIGRDGCEHWLQAALDVYFEHGLEAALRALNDFDKFIATRHKRARAVELSGVRRVLQHHGNRLARLH